MKLSAKSFHKKILLLILCTVVVAIGVVIALTTFSYKETLKEFGGSGYILVPSDKEVLTTDVDEMHYFSAGTTYREKFGESIVFKDTSNNNVKIDKEQFVHYTDGSLKAFTNGVVMSLTEVDKKQVSYFGVSDKTTIVKNATQYEMSYLGDVMQIQEFVWKIADDTYMVVAPEITVRLSKDKQVTFNDYVQIQYVDGEIVRLVHEQGTYQTVSSDAFIMTDGGVELRLLSKYFIVDGEEALSLESMIIDSDANLEVDENEDKLKLPTFNVVNGADGANGDNGENGDKGENGENGINGENGQYGEYGEDGKYGEYGEYGEDGELGENGDKGENGNKGENGIKGENGAGGSNGENGDKGENGNKGENGENGTAGEVGTDGEIGTDGEAGADGDSGQDGDNGGNGTDGEDGIDGEAGGQGAAGGNGGNGVNGEDGTDGLEGENGTEGATGQTGVPGWDGMDASVPVSPDGVGSIDQGLAPTVTIDSENYFVGADSAQIGLIVRDEGDYLSSNLTWAIYTRDGYKYVDGGGLPRTNSVLQTYKLHPDTEYVLIVSGKYQNDYGEFEQDFLTKIFETDKLGISLSKVQVTEDEITVRVDLKDGTNAGSYGIALYKEGEYDKAISVKTLLTGRKFSDVYTFSNDVNVMIDQTIYPDSNYVVKLVNIEDINSGQMIPVNISLDIRTLKTVPYYWDATKKIKVLISDVAVTAVSSDRYQTVTLSMESGIKDPDGGIVGYRYELYNTVNAEAGKGELVASKTLTSLDNVIFDVDPSANYYGRVVVLFKDNEKLVEIASNNSKVVTMENRVYPVTDIQIKRNEDSEYNETDKYDCVEGVITITDKHGMVINNIGNVVDGKRPLIVTIIGEDGNTKGITIAYPDETENQDGVALSDTKVYTFKQDGLKQNTTYSVRVEGPVNITDKNWGELDSAEKDKCSDYYLAGINFRTSNPTPLTAKFDASKRTTAGNAFEVRFAISDVNGETAYEVGNLERITFALYDSSHNQLGISHPMFDRDNEDEAHASDFSEIYNKDTFSNKDEFVLTDKDFAVEGDSRIVGGGTFYIKIIDSADYTVNDSKYPYFTNKMDWVTGSTECKFEITRKHTFSNDENNAISVEQIQKGEVEGLIQNTELEDDTVVGLKITPDYSWSDAKSITYFVYKVNASEQEPIIETGAKLFKSNWKYKDTKDEILPVGKKTIVISKADTGANVPPWIVYFHDESNKGDNGEKLFERGASYFIRYEVVCDGKIGDEKEYPACLYDADPPFYRSQIFNVLRQEPKLYRYLWDTFKTDDGKWTHQWKYLISDPDDAIFAESEEPEFYVYQPSNVYDTALSSLEFDLKNRREDLMTKKVSLTSLYSTVDNIQKWDKDYDVVSIKGLESNYFYNVEIDYRLCDYVQRGLYNAKTDRTASKFYHVDDMDSVDTTIERDDLTHWQEGVDYKVSGLLVKGIGTTEGVIEEGGYRIKLTIQGDDIDKIAALKVVLKSKDGSDKSVVYDPVPVVIATDNATGTGNISNNYGNAYLTYAPILEAGLTEKDVDVEVYAYCRTGNKGFKSFVDYKNYQDPASKLFTAESAWAIKGVTYTEGYNYVEQAYFITEGKDGTVSLAASSLMDKVIDKSKRFPTVQNSLMLPYMIKLTDSEIKNTGFSLITEAKDMANLNMMYAREPLAMFVKNQPTTNNILASVINQLYEMTNSQLPSYQIECRLDENGLIDKENRYLTVERLELKRLKLDFGTEDSSFESGTIKTGSGLPAIELNNSKTSIGRSSATLVFKTKGTFPGTYSDKTIYIELYDETNNKKIELNKYYYDDEKDVRHYFYATEAYKDKASAYEHLVTEPSELKGTSIVYGSTGDDGQLEIVVRGLEPSIEGKDQKYYVLVYAKDKLDKPQYLFDYSFEQIKKEYRFKTAGDITIVVNHSTWHKPLYLNKQGSFRFAISGSEGTNMAIYFKVLDKNDNEITPVNNGNYTTGYGYKIEPLGNLIKYYDSDPSTNNPIFVNLTPGGKLALNTEYKLQVTAYEAIDGKVNFKSQLGQTEHTFKSPEIFTEPRASVRITQGQKDLNVTINITDIDRVIMDDTYKVELYSTDGTLVRESSVKLGQSNEGKVLQAFVNFAELTENTSYVLKVVAQIDRDNNRLSDSSNGICIKEVNTSTVSQAEASVVYEFTRDGELMFTLLNCTNFENVYNVMYSIYSEDATEYIKSETIPLANWDNPEAGGNGKTYSYVVDEWEPSAYRTYSYVIQYYDEYGNLLGTTNGFFKKS